MEYPVRRRDLSFVLQLVSIVGLLEVPGGRSAEAGFAGTDVFVPAVARADGQAGARYFSTLWITNGTATPANVQIDLLLQGQPNPMPASRTEIVGAGATVRIDDVVGTYFGVTGKGAALRVRADRDVAVSSRTYSLPIGGELKDSVGLFFGCIPVSFAIGLSESATIQGVSNGAAESFRFNFGLVETTGQTVVVSVTVRDESGAELAPAQQYSLGGFEAFQVDGFRGFPVAVATLNGRIDVTVQGGLGKVIAYGTLVAGTSDNPGSNDSIGFEMGWKSTLPGLAGVSRLNGLSGDLNIKPGSGNVSISTSGSDILISATGGGGVSSLNGLTGPITLQAGANVFIIPTDAGHLQISAAGGPPTGAVLPFNLDTCPAGWIPLDGTNGQPDARGRTIIGAGQGQGLTLRARGSEVGAERFALQAGNLPSHSHYQQGFWADIYSGNTATVAYGGWSNSTVGSVGAYGVPFSLMQPSLALLYCQKD